MWFDKSVCTTDHVAMNTVTTQQITQRVQPVMIQYIYFIVCISFNLFLWTYPFSSYEFPYWVHGGDWPHAHLLLPYTIFGSSQDFPLLVITHDLFISTGSYALLSFPPIFHPYLYDWGCTTSIVMATHQPHLFNSCILCLLSFFYYILLCLILS